MHNVVITFVIVCYLFIFVRQPHPLNLFSTLKQFSTGVLKVTPERM